MIGKIDEALFAAEQGLTQTWSDNLLIQYDLAPRPSLAAKLDSTKTISLLLTNLSKHLVAEVGKENWFRQGRLGGDRTEKYPIRVLTETAFKRIGGDVYERQWPFDRCHRRLSIC